MRVPGAWFCYTRIFEGVGVRRQVERAALRVTERHQMASEKVTVITDGNFADTVLGAKVPVLVGERR